jgi:peptidoglycan/xylan/chitin deacetylase (PgdA/CDA1 family)
MKPIAFAITCILLFITFSFSKKQEPENAWIRINLLGYKPSGVKVAVWCSKENSEIKTFQLIDAATKKIAFSATTGKPFGAYGPFTQSYRLNFSSFKKSGKYYLQSGGVKSPVFTIAENVYDGAADFCLRYMRQQRSGFNPFLKDSCHTHDGYVLYGEKYGIKDSTPIDVVGGWHDASDYLQYAATSANATYHLLMAYRDFPKTFGDEKLANGLDGKNGMADVLDEAKWGLDWLLKMHPQPNVMFNQIADDRDHQGMRIPKEDLFYGRGFERPVYFLSGEPQQRGKFLNNTTGKSSTAGKFASAFALGFSLFKESNNLFADTLLKKSFSAFDFGYQKRGVSQTVSVKSPYIYSEDNWTDDMELASAILYSNTRRFEPFPAKFFDSLAKAYSREEKITPWLGADTAKHYQWYPFINIGHYELAKQLKGKQRDTIAGYYKEGIQRVWNKAKQNAFYRGVPFIWCSNNLTTSFAIQCYWYKQLTGDKQFEELEQANFDWLFGCNPWGTSMVYGLPAIGDTPTDPHSAFTHIKNYPIDGGLVDGPVYTSIYKNLIGIKLYEPDEYETFQSDLTVYHDDYGDYSTNEPTMDGTASLIYLLAAKESENLEKKNRISIAEPKQIKAEDLNAIPKIDLQEALQGKVKQFEWSKGAIVRGDSSQKKLALVFTGDEFADGGIAIQQTLKKENVKASFFFTGRFYRNNVFKNIIQQLKKEGNYLGAHSDQHLLYCDWTKRDSLLVTKQQFKKDMQKNYEALKQFDINKSAAHFFLPPYEWYNDSIALWTREMNLQLINYTAGTLSHADYTTPSEKNYRSSEVIYQSIIDYEQINNSGLNGFILLMHIGAYPKRTDKFYNKLPELIEWLKKRGYQLVRIDELLN